MRVTETFSTHVESVRRLMGFDRIVLDMAIGNLETLRERLAKLGVENPRLTAEGTLAALKAVRTNDSLRPAYQTIFNQALVLLVSYFASALHDVFRRGIHHLLQSTDESSLYQEEIKLSVRELKETSEDFANAVPDLLIQARDVSFQDMQSVSRSFKDYLGVVIERDTNVNDIILAQACRHVIVHIGGITDQKLLRQVEKARPRRVKTYIAPGERIQFAPEEIEIVAESMTAYLVALSVAVSAKVKADV